MKHLALIMDGNVRWAEKACGGDLKEGYRGGAEALLRAIEAADGLSIPYLTLYAFSNENFKREKTEIIPLFTVMADYLKNRLAPLIKEKNYRIRFIGDLSRLPLKLLDAVNGVNKAGLNNTGMCIIIALAYGGREEVLNAVNRVLKSRLYLSDGSAVTYDELEKQLYTVNAPDPDLIIRTGGYKRLSNFMPLQSIYSELMFLDKLWPEVQKEDIAECAERYKSIKRNFGE